MCSASICGSVFLAAVLAVLTVAVLRVRNGLVIGAYLSLSAAVPDENDHYQKDYQHSSEHVTHNSVEHGQSAEGLKPVPY